MGPLLLRLHRTMPKPKTSKKAGAAPPAPYDPPKKEKEPKGPIWEKKPRNFSIGGDIQPKRDLSRFVKWPKYVRLQRQRKVLMQRLKVPPSVAQFSQTLEKSLAINLFKLLNKYKAEDKEAKKERLEALAAAKAGGQEADVGKKPVFVKYGVNHVTKLVEQKKAQLVVIANDVDPIELVVWLPALCRKMETPYCIVKCKGRLGTVCGKKNATCLAITSIRNDDRHDLSQLVTAVRSQFNDRGDALRKTWGGGIMGMKSQRMMDKRAKAVAKEEAKKQQVA